MLQTLLCSRSTFCAASAVLLGILCSGQCDPDAEGCGPALPCPGSLCSTFPGLSSLTGLVPCGQRADCLLSWYFLSPSTSGDASNLLFTWSPVLPTLEDYFLFVGLCLKMCCQYLSWSISAMCLNLSGLKLRSLIHFELIFAQGEKYGYNFILLWVDIQLCNHHLLESLSFPQCMFLTHL